MKMNNRGENETDITTRLRSSKRNKLVKLIGVPSVYFLAEGIVFPSVGLFLVDFIDALKTNAGSMGLVHSLYLGLLILLGPLATSAAKRFGNRITIGVGCFMTATGLMVTSQVTHVWHIFLSHSLVTGCGLCLLTQGMVYDLASQFKKSASVYIGVMYAGSSIGFILNPLIFSQLRIYYGWRGTILLGSAVSLHMLPIVLILFRNTHAPNNRSLSVYFNTNDDGNADTYDDGDNDGDDSDRMKRSGDTVSIGELVDTEDRIKTGDENNAELTNLDTDLEKSVEKLDKPTILMFFKVPILLMIATVYFFGRFAFIGFFVHLSASLILRGFSEQEAALVFTAYGLGNLLGKSCCGLPGHLGVMSNYNLYTLSMFIIGFCFVMFSSVTNFAILLAFGFGIGVFLGVFVGLFPAITQECVCEEWFNFAYGYIGIPTGISSALGGYIMGAVYDTSGEYTLSFYIAGACFFFNGFLMLTTKCISQCRTKLRNWINED